MMRIVKVKPVSRVGGVMLPDASHHGWIIPLMHNHHIGLPKNVSRIERGRIVILASRERVSMLEIGYRPRSAFL